MIDFTRIKGDTPEGQRSFFEQLVCHLAQLDEDEEGGEFRRIEGSGGDGGVEALRILPTGSKIGYQAKYYPVREEIDWSKLDKSVETALTQHPQLERYVIALPCDFTGKRATRGGSTEGVWGKWDMQVEHWKELASIRGMSVKFEPWTAFEIEASLLRSGAQHLIRFFFDQLAFTREWMRRHLDRTLHDLQARYSPDEHVDTESIKAFDVMYRRENVRQDLWLIFKTAGSSSPRSAAALVERSMVGDADIIATENALKNFMALSDAISWSLMRPWPVCSWLTSWYALTRQLYAFSDRIRAGKRTDSEALARRVSEMTKEYNLGSPEVFGGRWAYMLPIDGARAALFVGRAGAGKSHVLARGSEVAWSRGAPVIHILGQHILDDDPRTSILRRLEITNWSFHDALSALNLAAEAADTRAMLIIDALNEGCGTDVWRNHLASFVREVNEHDRIVLVVSCREEYLSYVVPAEVIANPRPYPDKDGQPPPDCAPLGKLVSVSVLGFRTMEEREAALQKFMDEKGIARPTAPVLDAEFFNPLFMSSVCCSMARAGEKVFPRGLHGARDIFGFVLKTKAKAFGTRHDGTGRVYDALLVALNNLAGLMVERREDHVPLLDAINVINSAFGMFPLSGQTWLDVLEGSDILRRDVESASGEISTWSRPDEVVRFSFQRLQDSLMAESLLRKCRKEDLEDAFKDSAPFAFLVRRSVREDGAPMVKPDPRWVGVLGALWSAVAEVYSIELWDLHSFWGSPEAYIYRHDFQPVFHASVRERKGTAFTSRTKEILDFLWEDEQEGKLAIILSMSCVPEHAWNADFLMERLLRLSPDKRDVAWSRRFAGYRSDLIECATEIADWSMNVDIEIADQEVIRLAGMTLTWLLIASSSGLRDQAAKGVLNLVAGAPTLLQYLQNRFQAVDAFQIQEILLLRGQNPLSHPDS